MSPGGPDVRFAVPSSHRTAKIGSGYAKSYNVRQKVLSSRAVIDMTFGRVETELWKE